MADTMTLSGNGTGPVGLAWEPETPFLNPPVMPSVAAEAAPGRPYAPRPAIESPFTAEYAGAETPSAHAGAFASLVDELRDDEFAEALEDLVNDASAVLEDGFSGEIGDPVRERFAMERTMRDYLEPLSQAAEEMLDGMAAGLADKDLSSLSESEIDTLLEAYSPDTAEMNPAFENFLGGLMKKAKKAMKGALKVARTLAAPHLLILNRLKGLVRPLLERVLRFAIGKLPVALRPIASQLAERFLGIKSNASAAKAAEPSGEPAAADPGELQSELDTRLAGYLVGGESFEQDERAVESSGTQLLPGEEPMQELERARRDFAEGIVSLDAGEDATPQVEHFIPAILAALKLGISVVGRPRVVKFLANMVANLIAKYVGKEQASALSGALVDAGLRAVSLEVVDEDSAAGEALAATVEDTVTRVVQSAPSSAWQSEALLEAYVQEAFQQAASAHFPDSLIREELHEAASASGTWVALPAATPRKRYKKYSRVLEVSITPQIAAAVKTYGGVPLRQFLVDRLGVQLDQPVRARVHLYEALAGTRLSLIALHERGVAGLGHARRHGWSLFHPLTPEAAGVLLNEPGLGKAVDPAFLVKRRVTAVGQRFYYLEIPGARVRLAPRRPGAAGRPARSSQVRVVFDFVKRQLRVALYYSEADAQRIGGLLRQKLPVSALLSALKARHDAQIRQVLTSRGSGAVRVVHESAPTEESEAPVLGSILGIAGGQVSEMLTGWVLNALKRELEARAAAFAAEFERAANADDDGVTVLVRIDAGPVFAQLRKLLADGALSAPTALLGLAKATVGDVHVEVRPGFVPA